jgi:hypothetical protein
MADTKTEAAVMCGNVDHETPAPAVARLFYPNGRFVPTTACADDLEWVAEQALDEKASVLIEPVEHDHGAIAEAVKEVSRRHRRAYSEPVKAILLEAPDMPGYDTLPETLEERQQLPARFHIPRWDGDGEPNLWLCAVCWDEGTATQWPCATAAKHGGEVFAR